MADFKVGDAVQVKTREVTGEDLKSSLYFAYFAGLIGAVDKVYDDGAICVDVDINSLSNDARKRHLDTQEAERKRWLDGLSGEARNRLTEDQKKLKMAYKILVSSKDLELYKGDGPKPTRSVDKAVSSEDSVAIKEGSTGGSDPKVSTKADEDDIAAPKRLSEADLAAKEEEFLKSLQQKQQ